MLSEIEDEYDNIRIYKYEVGNVLPVIVFLDKNGKELERLIGEQKESKLIEIIDKYMVM